MNRADAQRYAVELYRNLQMPEPEGYRLPLSPPGFRRPAAAGDDGDGDGLQAGPHRLRRANDRTRRHHPDRSAGDDEEDRPRVRHRRHLRDARSRGGRPDGRPHHGVALRQAGRGSADADHAVGTTRRLYEVAVGGTLVQAGTAAGGNQGDGAGDCRRRRLGVLRSDTGAAQRVVQHPQGPHRRSGRRVGYPASRRRHAASPACCHRSRGASASTARCCQTPSSNARASNCGACR